MKGKREGEKKRRRTGAGESGVGNKKVKQSFREIT